MPSLESTISSRIVLQSRATLSEAEGVNSGPADGLLSRHDDLPDSESLLNEELAEGEEESLLTSETVAAREPETVSPEPSPFAGKSTDALSFAQLFGSPAGEETQAPAQAVEPASEAPGEPVPAEAAQEAEPSLPGAVAAAADAENDLWLEYVSPVCPPPIGSPLVDAVDSEAASAAGEPPATDPARTSADEANDDTAHSPEADGDAPLLARAQPDDERPQPTRSADDDSLRRSSLSADALLASRLEALLGKQRSLLDRMSAARAVLDEKTDPARMVDPFAGPLEPKPPQSDFEALESEPLQSGSHQFSDAEPADHAPAPSFIAAIAAAQKAPSDVRQPARERPRPPVFSADASQHRDLPFPSVVRASAEHQRSMGPERAAPSPWPGLIGGFGLSLLLGGVLYLALQLA
jgi:hypothetical protein